VVDVDSMRTKLAEPRSVLQFLPRTPHQVGEGPRSRGPNAGRPTIGTGLDSILSE